MRSRALIAGSGQNDVAGLQIAMRHAAAVRHVERAGQLDSVLQHLGRRQRIQAGNSFRFALEALPPDHIVGEMGGKDFDGDGAVKACVDRPIYFAHPASTNWRGNLENSSGRLIARVCLDESLRPRRTLRQPLPPPLTCARG